MAPPFTMKNCARTSKPRRVWFSGSTALKKGQGVCFDRDYTTTVDGQTATDPFGGRDSIVQVPASGNNMAFAGVVSQDYAANAAGQMIEIYEPGGVAEILLGADTVVGTTLLTCSADSVDAGRFTWQGLPGRGTALALETNASGAKFASIDGSATAAYAASVTTVTATGIGTASAAGDRLVVLGGADDTAGGDAATGEMAVVGTYTIVTAPTANTVTIAEDIGDVDIACYVLGSEEQYALAYLFDGSESGLTEFISPQDAVAVASMVGGTTFICGGYTMAADSTFTLADGTINGMQKRFVCLGALTTQDYLVTVTSGLQGDVSTALASLEFDAAGDQATLEWNGSGGASTGSWVIKHLAGAAVA